MNISKTKNLESIVHDYFDELIAINSIIYKYDISDININPANECLTANINFESSNDCSNIFNITKNTSVTVYGENINISSNTVNDKTLCIKVVKNKKN